MLVEVLSVYPSTLEDIVKTVSFLNINLGHNWDSWVSAEKGVQWYCESIHCDIMSQLFSFIKLI